ncbi:MAG: hypothetical protein IJW21_05790, partial [Clostridia bacterium]|nr:hypothetical protein [Clostridia bacterium]
GGNGGENDIGKPELAPVNVDKIYDGATLYAKPSIRGFETYAKLGYTYKNLRVSGSQTVVGYSESVIESITIYDPDGNDVTDEFRLVPGKVHVYYYEISMQSAYGNFMYGSADAANSVTITGGRLLGGHSYTVAFESHPVGTHSNTFEVTIKDSRGTDVTAQYKINKDYGTLNIFPNELTVTAASARKTYDGTALTSNNYTVTGKLAEGDKIAVCEVEGTQTNAGRSENAIVKFVIHNSRGEDVTSNYNVTMVPGTLTVTRK